MATSSSKSVSCYTKREASYGVAEALAAADYLPWVMSAPVVNTQLAAIPNESQTPGRDRYTVDRGRPTSSLTVTTTLRGAPTGVTPPVYGRMIEAAMGGDPIVVDAAADVTGNANTGVPLFVAGATDGMFRPHIGGTAAGSELIDLSGNAIYKSVVYRLAGTPAARDKSLTFRYQPREAGSDGAPAQLVAGWKPNMMTLAVDGSGTPGTVAFDGPASRVYHGEGALTAGGAGANVALPTAVDGAQNMNGIPARVWFRRHGTSGAFVEITQSFRNLTLELNNNIAMRNDEARSLYSVGVVEDNDRAVTLTFGTYAEEDNAFYPEVKAGLAADELRHYTIFVAIGNQEGARIGLYLPRVLFDLPNADDGNRLAWPWTGIALADTYGDGESSMVVGLG